MRWRGPRSTCRSRLVGSPSSTGSGGPTAGASHPRPVPVARLPSAFPGVSPGEVSVSDVEVVLLPESRAAQASEESNGDFFRYPHNDGGYPRMSGVVHRLVHSISTGHRLACRAGARARSDGVTDAEGARIAMIP